MFKADVPTNFFKKVVKRDLLLDGALFERGIARQKILQYENQLVQPKYSIFDKPRVEYSHATGQRKLVTQ